MQALLPGPSFVAGSSEFPVAAVPLTPPLRRGFRLFSMAEMSPGLTLAEESSEFPAVVVL